MGMYISVQDEDMDRSLLDAPPGLEDALTSECWKQFDHARAGLGAHVLLDYPFTNEQRAAAHQAFEANVFAQSIAHHFSAAMLAMYGPPPPPHLGMLPGQG